MLCPFKSLVYPSTLNALKRLEMGALLEFSDGQEATTFGF
jgi:hypothetical protein